MQELTIIGIGVVLALLAQPILRHALEARQRKRQRRRGDRRQLEAVFEAQCDIAERVDKLEAAQEDEREEREAPARAARRMREVIEAAREVAPEFKRVIEEAIGAGRCPGRGSGHEVIAPPPRGARLGAILAEIRAEAAAEKAPRSAGTAQPGDEAESYAQEPQQPQQP